MSKSNPPPFSTTKTFYDALTAIPAPFSETNLPVAVELIRYLRRGVAHDACTASTNVQVLGWIGSRAQKIFETILGHIKQVNEKTESDPVGAFEAFKKYTALVQPLEDALFDAVVLNNAEIDLVATELKSREKIYEPYNTWWNNRRSLRTVVGKLYDGDLATLGGNSTEHNAAKTYDDLSFFELVATRIQNQTATLTDPKYDALNVVCRSVKAKYDAMHKAFRTQPGELTDDFLNLSVRSASVLLGILTSSAPMMKARRPWKDASTWIDAEGILEKLSQNIADSQPFSQDLQKEWDDFEIGLFVDDKTPAELRKLIMDLLQNVANIHRAFYAQAFTLVLQCYELEEKSRKNGRDGAKLQLIIADITTALRAALVSNNPNLLTIAEGEDVLGYPGHQPFQTAINSLTTGFTDYSVNGTAITAIETAKSVDTSAIKMLIERRADVARRIERKAQTTSIGVKVSGGGGKPNAEGEISENYEVDENMPIEGILWNIRQKSYGADVFKYCPRFFRKAVVSLGTKNVYEPLDRKLTIAELMRGGAPSNELYVVVEDLAAYEADFPGPPKPALAQTPEQGTP